MNDNDHDHDKDQVDSAQNAAHASGLVETHRTQFGICPLCRRELSLTFHHLIPRKLHRRSYFRKHYSREELNLGINICRACHNGIHRFYDEMTLAKRYSRVENLQNDESLKKHFEWVSRQKRK